MVVGYSAFQTKLEIKGTSKVTSNWDIEITNVTEGTPTGSGENTVAPFWSKTTASMEANLYDKGDIMKYIVIFIMVCMIGCNNVFAVSYSEIDSLFDKTNAFINKQNEYEDLNKIYPVGSIYISTKDTDPSELFGGIWERYAGGRKLVGIGSNGTTNYNSVGMAQGNKEVSLSINNIPAHSHTLTPSGTVSSIFKGSAVTISSSGGSSSIDIMNPYITVYMWKRIS